MKLGSKSRLFLPLLAAVLLLIGLLVGLLSDGRSDRADVHLVTPEGESVLSVHAGEAVHLEDAEAPEGYVFLGWRGEDGTIDTREYIPIAGDCWFAAEYAVDLDRTAHKAYLFPDENAFFRPDAELTRADAARMLYTLLAAPVESDGNFSDVKANDPWAPATAALKTLGVAEGGRFRPNRAVTKGELYHMLSHFFAPAAEPYRFKNILPGDELYAACCVAAREGWIKSGRNVSVPVEETLTRREAAALMNRILGRSEKPRATAKQVGAPVDLNPKDKDYWTLVEACVSHEFETDAKGEKWTGSVPVEPVPEGPYLLDLQLYWIGEDGVALRNADMDNLHFGADGRYTSGNEELDGLIRGILAEIYEEGMSREELLRAAYLHTRDSYSYLRREPFAFGDTSWLVDEAIALITTGRGNCYSYAAVFCELARAIGYDAVIYSGTFGANLAPHAWVEIVREDGEPHIFDVEIEMARKYNAGVEEDHYDLSYEDAEVYTYIRERKYYYW